MAKENFVLLMGQLRNEPKFATDPVSGVESALFQLWVVRRNPNDEAGNISPKWDKPLYQQQNHHWFARLRNLSYTIL